MKNSEAIQFIKDNSRLLSQHTTSEFFGQTIFEHRMAYNGKYFILYNMGESGFKLYYPDREENVVAAIKNFTNLADLNNEKRDLKLEVTASVDGKIVEQIPFFDKDEYNTEDTYNDLIKKYCRTKNAEVNRNSIHLFDRWISCIDIVTPEQLAESFAKTIKEWLDAEEMEQVIIRNEVNMKDNNGCCATHDFCDANMAMIEALNEYKIVFETADEVQSKLIDKAWSIAKQNKFWYETVGKNN